MQYLLSIRAATCQGRKWAWLGRICSWQIILGLHLSFHYFSCTKENFVSLFVSRNSQEFKLGCFLLWHSPSWFFFFHSSALVPALPFSRCGKGFLVDSYRIQPVLRVLSAGVCQVWLTGKTPTRWNVLLCSLCSSWLLNGPLFILLAEEWGEKAINHFGIPCLTSSHPGRRAHLFLTIFLL